MLGGLVPGEWLIMNTGTMARWCINSSSTCQVGRALMPGRPEWVGPFSSTAVKPSRSRIEKPAPQGNGQLHMEHPVQ